jgi:hypothetical protein
MTLQRPSKLLLAFGTEAGSENDNGNDLDEWNIAQLPKNNPEADNIRQEWEAYTQCVPDGLMRPLYGFGPSGIRFCSRSATSSQATWGVCLPIGGDGTALGATKFRSKLP